MSLITIAVGVVVSVLVFTWLIKVVKATLKTAFLIALILFGLNFFGIGPGNLVDTAIEWIAGTFPPQPK
jgi:cytochrome c biogenesis protein CcdA